MTPLGIELLILDVDGVLTGGEVASGEHGDPGRTFHIRDGHALKVWQRMGGVVAIISGRQGDDVARRASELGITHVYQGVADKIAALAELLSELGLSPAVAAYVGDDLPDVPIMAQVGVAVAVADAAGEAKRAAQLVTRRPGGRGAVAEAVEWLLRKNGLWKRDRLYST